MSRINGDKARNRRRTRKNALRRVKIQALRGAGPAVATTSAKASKATTKAPAKAAAKSKVPAKA